MDDLISAQTHGGHFLHTMEKIVEKGEHGEGLDIIHKFITNPNVKHEYSPESGQRQGSMDQKLTRIRAIRNNRFVVSLAKDLNILP